MRQTAQTIDAILGPDRRRQLAAAAADRLVLNGDMSTLAQATRYVEQTWPAITSVVAIGQRWRARPGTYDGDEITITGIDRPNAMVGAGEGRWLSTHYVLSQHFDLVDWPAEQALTPDPVSAPAAALAPPEEQRPDYGDEPRFDPAKMFFIVARAYEPGTLPVDEDGHPVLPPHLPMLAEHWISYPAKNVERFGYFTFVDAVALLRRDLGNYRAGWSSWQDQWRRGEAMFHFNAFSDEPAELDTPACAYLGNWLWNTVRAEVVREHGGRVTDFEVDFQWAPSYINGFLQATPYADPDADLPDDHPLMQCPGQAPLLADLE